jgi:hypothetical protein
VAPPAGADLPVLRALYAAAWAKRQGLTPPAETIASDPAGEQVAEADLRQRLRRQLIDRHGVEPAAEATLAELRSERDRLAAADAARDQAVIAAKLAAAAAAAPVWSEPAPAAAAAGRPPVAAGEPPAASGLRVVPVQLLDPGIGQAMAVDDGRVRVVIAQLGDDAKGAFRNLPQALWTRLSAAPAIRRAACVLGHGDGYRIGGVGLTDHLRKHRTFYETIGGTAPAQRLDCLIIASCSAGSAFQMEAMRDGLGYYPTWRVASGARTYADAASVLSAVEGVVARRADEPYRAVFRWRAELPVACFGEVGPDGERANLQYFRIVADPADPKGWRVEEQR